MIIQGNNVIFYLKELVYYIVVQVILNKIDCFIDKNTDEFHFKFSFLKIVDQLKININFTVYSLNIFISSQLISYQSRFVTR